MNLFFRTNQLKKQLSSSSEIKRAFGINAKRVQQRLDDISASPNLAVLLQIKAANCHPLDGGRRGEWAVNISANHRMIFEIAHEPIPKNDYGQINTLEVTDIRVIETTDYH